MKEPSDLHVAFLNKIMAHMRGLRWDMVAVGSDSFRELLPEDLRASQREGLHYIRRHLEYLESMGLLSLKMPAMDGSYGVVELTAHGRQFVQPELAEFSAKLVTNLVSQVEEKIGASNLPQEEKEDWKFKLRKAVSKAIPEAAARLIVEILKRIGGS